MISPDQALPHRVRAMLGLDERVIAHVWGIHDSGVLLTDRRLLAWRVNGVSPGLQLADVDRMQYDRGARDALLVVPRAASHVPLVVMVDAADRAAGEQMMAAITHAVMARAEAGGGGVTAEEGEFMGVAVVRFHR